MPRSPFRFAHYSFVLIHLSRSCYLPSFLIVLDLVCLIAFSGVTVVALSWGARLRPLELWGHGPHLCCSLSIEVLRRGRSSVQGVTPDMWSYFRSSSEMEQVIFFKSFERKMSANYKVPKCANLPALCWFRPAMWNCEFAWTSESFVNCEIKLMSELLFREGAKIDVFCFFMRLRGLKVLV